MKKGMAIKGKESNAENVVCVIIINGILLVKAIVIKVANPKEIPIGTLIDMKKNNKKNSNPISTS
jgi:hypothetical protein